MKRKSLRVRGLLMGLVLLPWLCAATASAAVSSRLKAESGKDLAVIANDFLALSFEPALGGRCVECRRTDRDCPNRE